MMQLDAPVRLAPRQRARAVAALVAAFVDDPGYVYVLPDARERSRAVARFMDALVSFGLIYGEVYTTAELRGVACWLPVRGPSLSLWQLVRTRFGLPRAMLSLRGESRARMSDILRYNDEIHAGAVKGLHWYLGTLGVLPEWRRRGIGTGLLQPMLARADAESAPCYLETQTADNVRLYSRLGFEVIHEGEVPGHPLRMWAMLRRPHLRQ